MGKQEIYLQIQSLLVKLFELDADDIKPESRLYEELELDSIDAVDLVVHLQKTTGKRSNRKCSSQCEPYRTWLTPLMNC